MADYLIYLFLVVWSVWGIIHAIKRAGFDINAVEYTLWFRKNKDGAYEIKNKQKKIMVLFAEGPIIWTFKVFEVLWVVLITVTKFVLVVPFKALDKWAQEDSGEDKDDSNNKKDRDDVEYDLS